MCEKMAISAHILKMVKNDPFLWLQMTAKEMRGIKLTKRFNATQHAEREIREIKSRKIFKAIQRSVAVQEREMREKKLRKGFIATQCGSVRKRTEREIKLTKRFNATLHGSARKRTERNKVDKEVQRYEAGQCKKEK